MEAVFWIGFFQSFQTKFIIVIYDHYPNTDRGDGGDRGGGCNDGEVVVIFVIVIVWS